VVTKKAVEKTKKLEEKTVEDEKKINTMTTVMKKIVPKMSKKSNLRNEVVSAIHDVD
jgi:hypothetical protein